MQIPSHAHTYEDYIQGTGLPWCLSGKESACQCRRLEFNSWTGKIPWRWKWQPAPVFWPGESHGQWSLVGYSTWGRKESDTTEPLTYTHTGHWYWWIEAAFPMSGHWSLGESCCNWFPQGASAHTCPHWSSAATFHPLRQPEQSFCCRLCLSAWRLSVQ